MNPDYLMEESNMEIEFPLNSCPDLKGPLYMPNFLNPSNLFVPYVN